MEIKKITRDEFEREVLHGENPALLMFYKDGCSPCKAMLPILEQAAEMACDVRFCRVDAEEESDLAEKYGVRAVPTMVILSGETVFRTISGLHSLDEILEYLEM